MCCSMCRLAPSRAPLIPFPILPAHRSPIPISIPSKVGSQVLLVVTSVTPPAIAGQTAVPSSIEANQMVTITATVTPG